MQRFPANQAFDLSFTGPYTAQHSVVLCALCDPGVQAAGDHHDAGQNHDDNQDRSNAVETHDVVVCAHSHDAEKCGIFCDVFVCPSVRGFQIGDGLLYGEALFELDIILHLTSLAVCFRHSSHFGVIKDSDQRVPGKTV